jgi:creatinine amidohydrolase
MNKKVFLSFMSWAEIKEALESGTDLVIIPCGSSEQHGPHRPTGDDWIFALEASIRIAEKMDEAVVSPPLTVGVAPYHMEWPGTVTLPRCFHKELVKHVVKSLHYHGFKRFVLLNTHGGNTLSLKIAQTELKEEVPDLKVAYTPWWSVCTKKFVEEELGLPYEKWDGSHGGGSQTSCMLAIEKKYGLNLVDVARAPPASRDLPILQRHTGNPYASLPLTGIAFKRYSPNGVMYKLDDSNKLADPEIGERTLDKMASFLAKQLKDPDTWLW